MHELRDEHTSKMELGDKETVAICIQASVICYLHVIHRYTRMVYKIVPYVRVPTILRNGTPSSVKYPKQA